MPAAAAKRARVQLIKQVREVDLLVCPSCAVPMRIIACIGQPAFITKILPHLGLWPTPAYSPPIESLAA